MVIAILGDEATAAAAESMRISSKIRGGLAPAAAACQKTMVAKFCVTNSCSEAVANFASGILTWNHVAGGMSPENCPNGNGAEKFLATSSNRRRGKSAAAIPCGE